MSTPKYNERVRMTSAEALSILGREKPVFLKGLSQAEVEMVVAKASIRRYAANAVITNEAAGANHLFLLLEGAGRGYALTSRGEKIGLGWFPAGRIMGWAALVSQRLDYIVSMEAVTSSSALVWDRITIQALAATLPRLLENALSLAYDYVVVYRGLHLAALCDSAPQRLAQVLVQLAKGMGHKVDHGIELNISNEELANEAHVTIFTVSRLMREWRQRGLLTKGRGSIVVRQPDELLRVKA
jgi:CRP/FNR family transcriptional regulator, nitrogen oxide reductase regulator